MFASGHRNPAWKTTMRRTNYILGTVASLSISFVEAAAAQSAAELVETWLPVSAVNIRPDGTPLRRLALLSKAF